MPTLSEYFHSNANRVFDEREKRYATIDTPEKVIAFQKQLRALARETFGPYILDLAENNTPPTVLKAGEVQRDGVVIEKFLYEALPDFWVSALLYRPASHLKQERYPALVMPVGHWWAGKAHPMYQKLMQILARRGVICVSFDGCGQGERMEWVNLAVRDSMSRLAANHPVDQAKPYPLQDAPAHGFWAANNVTSAHCIIGDPGYLCGVHQHALTVSAGKRLVDVLVARADVNPEKIGACGASGGGTDTRFLASIDPRLALAIPTSILGSDRAMSGGDADQSFFGSIHKGISHVDLITCMAPKPVLIISASEDKHDTAKVAAFYRPFWNAFGKGDKISAAVGHGAHGFPHETRKIIAEFVLRELRGETHVIPDAEHSDDLPVYSELELQTTLTGNVGLDGVGKSPFDLIRERTAALEVSRPTLKGALLRAEVVRTLGESEESLNVLPKNVQSNGEIARRETIWEGEGGVPLRMLCHGSGQSLAVILHENGAESAISTPLFLSLKSSAEKNISTQIARADLRGMGISATSEDEPNSAFLSPLLLGKQASLARMVLHQGRTLLGMRAVDILQCAQVLKHSGAGRVDLFAEGGVGLAALLAVYLAPDTFGKVVLYRTPLSWRELTSGTGRIYNFAHFLYGVLEHFDTRDLTRDLPAGKVIWINPTDATGKVVAAAYATQHHRSSATEFKHVRVQEELTQVLERLCGSKV